MARKRKAYIAVKYDIWPHYSLMQVWDDGEEFHMSNTGSYGSWKKDSDNVLHVFANKADFDEFSDRLQVLSTVRSELKNLMKERAAELLRDA